MKNVYISHIYNNVIKILCGRVKGKAISVIIFIKHSLGDEKCAIILYNNIGLEKVF